ncbi:MAG: GNAT family N-acyltransferase [Bacteroidota bacterium]
MKAINYEKDSSILFTTGDYQVEMCLTAQQWKAALVKRAKFYDVTEDQLLSPEGDEFDYQSNCKLFTVKRGNEIVGTVRSLTYNSAYGWQACQLSGYYPESFEAFDTQNRTALLESSRFAISPKLDRRASFEIQGILFRVHNIAVAVEQVDYMTTIIRPRHQRFYEKYMGMHAIAPMKVMVGLDLVPMAVSLPQECSFSYSDIETLGIDIQSCIERYKELRTRLLAFSGIFSSSTMSA